MGQSVDHTNLLEICAQLLREVTGWHMDFRAANHFGGQNQGTFLSGGISAGQPYLAL